MNYKRLSDIEARPIPRALTGFDELDFVYGYSVFPEATYWGMPVDKISLWAGTSGIGKSRLAIDVAKRFSLGDTVLYFQTEASLEDFAGWTKNPEQYKNFYCSGENKIDEMIKIIYELKPKLVIIDSVNEIEEFCNGNKKETRRLIYGEDGSIGLKKVIADIHSHLILLGQLNSDGTIKGGTSLPHLVDIALNLTTAYGDKSLFQVDVGVKHRYGRRDKEICAVFMHEENGVKCIDELSQSDPIWCKSHGLPSRTRGEFLAGLPAGYVPAPMVNISLPPKSKWDISYWF